MHGLARSNDEDRHPPEGRSEGTYKPSLSGRAPKLRVQGLSVTYLDRNGRQTEAVRDVSFDVEDKPGAGEIVVFLGPSGCGKSTILKAVAGLLAPNKGEILLDGKLVKGVGRDRGMVFQAYTSFGWLTVRENVAYGLRLRGVPGRERRKRVQHPVRSAREAERANEAGAGNPNVGLSSP